jgi:IS5 family transposase
VFDSGCKRGQQIGPNPTDRGKPGTKRHLAVDRSGTPLVVLLSGANVHDSRMLESLLEALPPYLPGKLHADKGYDAAHCRESLTKRTVLSRIARRNVESSHRLGRHRWVVERTFAWLNRFRRLRVRYERRADIHLAFLLLACALICVKRLKARFC